MSRPSNRLTAGLAAIAATVGLLVACSAPQPSQADEVPPPFLSEHYQKLSDGRVVLCLVRHNPIIAGYASTRSTISIIDCDWANAKVQP